MANSTLSGINIDNDFSNSIVAGFIQFNPILGDLEANRKQLEPLLSKASKADLIVIPELANSGYNFQSKEEAYSLSEDLKESPFLEFLIHQSQKHSLYLVAGINERDAGLLYNTSVLVGPEGFIGKYRKIHLFMNEFDLFERGNLGLPVFELKGCRVGMLICFDWMFPEVWRKLALQNVDLICHPSNLVLPYAQQAVPVHSLINRIYTITANRYGTEHGVTFSGQSIIANPFGKTLYTAQINRDEVWFQKLDIEKARDKNITKRNHAFKDRLQEWY